MNTEINDKRDSFRFEIVSKRTHQPSFRKARNVQEEEDGPPTNQLLHQSTKPKAPSQMLWLTQS